MEIDIKVLCFEIADSAVVVSFLFRFFLPLNHLNDQVHKAAWSAATEST